MIVRGMTVISELLRAGESTLMTVRKYILEVNNRCPGLERIVNCGLPLMALFRNRVGARELWTGNATFKQDGSAHDIK